MKYYAIIVAGGKGTRMNSKVPKQFMLLDRKPVLLHCMEKFHKANPKIVIIVVLPLKDFGRWGKLLKKYPLIKHILVEGGETRFHSVQNGLEAVNDDGIVAVHDGARPLVSKELITLSYKEAAKHGSAVPCIQANESLRKVKGKKNKTINRNSIVVIQTPQCFDAKILKKAYKTKYRDAFTDDASVIESMGKKIHLVSGEKGNIKITTADDLLIAEALLRKK